MKKSQKIVLIISLILIIIAGLTYTTFAVTGKINVETVRLRETASTESQTLTMGDLGTEVEILEEEDGWYKVSYNGQEGYIYKDYIDIVEEESSEQTAAENTTTSDTSTTEENVTSNETEDQISDETEQVEQTEKTTELGNKLNKDTSAYLLPNYTSSKIMELHVNDEVKIITTLANWVKIETSGKNVWIPKIFLTTDVTVDQEEQPTEEPEETSEEVAINQTGYISSNSSANLRQGPSTETESLGKLARYTELTVISEANDWYKVSYNGQEGYVSKSLITLGNAPAEDVSSRSSVSRAGQEVVASAGVSSVASIASQYVGCSYVYGGSSPSGFDCSGFTSYVYSQAGISISRTSYSQANEGTAVSRSDLQPGDLIVFSGASHVGIYVGNGQFIHASNPSLGVRYDTIDSGYWSRTISKCTKILRGEKLIK